MSSTGPASRVTGLVRAVRQGGLVRLSTRITPRGIVRGAAAGRFPYPRTDGSRLVPWYVPHERAVLRAENVHLGDTLRRRLRRQGWETSVDEAFHDVVRGCADRETTWISPHLQQVYGELHRQGHAHSVEVWNADGRLVAGVFGVQAGGMFAIDSMFHVEDHASKAAAVDLAHRVRDAGGVGVDCQLPTRHFLALGAEVLDRRTFLGLLRSGQGTAPRLATERLPAARLAERPAKGATGGN
jgi:leucyl/phenylalanyl-tRNA--protein transferase